MAATNDHAKPELEGEPDAKRPRVDDETKVRSTTASGSMVYESKRATDEYLHFHYAPGTDLLPYADGPQSALDFPGRCARFCVEAGPANKKRAIDIGCAVGRSSFELAREFEEVVGMDFSHAFIDAANAVKETGKAAFTYTIEGNIRGAGEATLDETIDRSRVTFFQGDACNLPEDLGEFDALMAANLICRLPDPRKFLERVPSLIAPGGVVVFVSPFSWLEEYTPPGNWLGGYNDEEGNPVDSPTVLEAIMKDLGFALIEKSDVPFLIREHARKFQWGCSCKMVFKRPE